MFTVALSRPESDADPVRPSVLLLYFLRLGAFGFGSPIALSAAMRRDLVEARGWITDTEGSGADSFPETIRGESVWNSALCFRAFQAFS